jgi:hypothetical protein
MLAATFPLWDVEDTEAFCAALIQRSRLTLTTVERDDLLAYLIAEAWTLSLRYDPAVRTFASFAGSTLRLRVIDWYRRERGRTRWTFADRTYERPLPTLVSLDADRDSLGDADAGGAGDSPADRVASLDGLLAGGSRATDRDLRILRRLLTDLLADELEVLHAASTA